MGRDMDKMALPFHERTFATSFGIIVKPQKIKVVPHRVWLDYMLGRVGELS
jgi:hypothetical protein